MYGPRSRLALEGKKCYNPGFSISHHHVECGCGRRWKVEELSHTRLNEIMRASTVDRYHNLVVSDKAEKVKYLWFRGSFHGVETDMRN